MKKNKIVIVIISSVIILLIVLYNLFNWMMAGIIHRRKEVIVPDLKGKQLSEAVSILSSLNLGLKKEGEFPDQSMPAGAVIRQSPISGLAVREGKIIKVTVSQGGSFILMPNFTGQTIRSAEIAIRSAGFTLGEVTSRYSLTGKKDCVLSQDPLAGTSFEKDSMINLVISAGQPPANIKLMPDFINKNIDEASKWAAQNNFEMEIIEENIENSSPGSIIGQDPTPDTDLAGVRKVVFKTTFGKENEISLSRKFYYEVPKGSGDMQLRLALIDEKGETEIFKGVKAPGTRLELNINPKGNSRVRVFINGILVEEREAK